MTQNAYRGNVTRADDKGVWVEVPSLGGAEYGPMEVMVDQEGINPRYAVGDRVLIAQIGTTAEEFGVLGHIRRAYPSQGTTPTPPPGWDPDDYFEPVLIDIGAGADLNSYKTTGWFRQGSNANINPGGGLNYPGTDAGLLEVFSGGNGGMVWQRYTEFNSSSANTDQNVWLRSFYSNNWGPWRRYLLEGWGMYTIPRLRLSATDDASETSVNHALQIGPTTGFNLIIDSNEIIARNNGALGDPVGFPSGVWGLPAPASPSSAANKAYVDALRTDMEKIEAITELGAGVNLNTITTTGVYRQSMTANAQGGTNYPGKSPQAGLLEVFEIPSSNMTWQRYTEYSSAGKMYWRSRYNSSWYPWHEMAEVGPNLVDDLKSSNKKIIVAHRGGMRVWPEHSMEAYRDTFESGFIIEADLRTLSTGEMVCIHDASTLRTMTGPNTTVSAMTMDDWLSRDVLHPWVGGDGGTPAVWEDVLNEFGGRGVIMVELKNVATNLFIDSVLRRGLQKSIIVQSFTLSVVQQTAAAGIPSLYLAGSTTTVTPAQLVSSKIDFFGPSSGMNSTDIASFRSAGIKVVPYTVETKADWVSLKAKNVDGAFFNDPWGATDRFPKSFRDPFTNSKKAPYGWDYYDSASTPNEARQPFINYRGPQGTIFLNGLGGNAGTKCMRQGWAPKLTMGSDAILFRAKVGFYDGGGGTTGSSTRWMAVFLGTTPNDQAYNDVATVGQYGYHFLFRRNGVLGVYRTDSGAEPLLLSEFDGASLTTADQMHETEIEIILNGSGIRARNLATGESVGSVTDGTYRTNLGLHLSCSGTNGQWRDINYQTVEPTLIGY